MLSQCTLLKTDRFGRSLTLFVKADTCCENTMVFSFTLQNPAGIFLFCVLAHTWHSAFVCVFECMLLAEPASDMIWMCLICADAQDAQLVSISAGPIGKSQWTDGMQSTAQQFEVDTDASFSPISMVPSSNQAPLFVKAVTISKYPIISVPRSFC